MKVDEIWKRIKNFPDYQISNYGRVKSFKQNKKNGKILKNSENSHGYFVVELFNEKRKVKKIHKLVYEAFIENIENNECVHHKNENKLDNYFKNLNKLSKKEHDEYHTNIRFNTDGG